MLGVDTAAHWLTGRLTRVSVLGSGFDVWEVCVEERLGEYSLAHRIAGEPVGDTLSTESESLQQHETVASGEDEGQGGHGTARMKEGERSEWTMQER